MLTGFNFTRQANWSVTQVWIHYLDNTCVNKLISIQENFHHSLKAVAQITRARNFDKSTAFVNVLDRQTGDNRNIEFVIVASDHTDNIVLSHCDIQGKEGRWNRAVWKPHMASASRTFLGRFGWFAHCCWSWPFTSSIARSWRKNDRRIGFFDASWDFSSSRWQMRWCLQYPGDWTKILFGHLRVCRNNCIRLWFGLLYQQHLSCGCIPRLSAVSYHSVRKCGLPFSMLWEASLPFLS